MFQGGQPIVRLEQFQFWWWWSFKISNRCFNDTFSRTRWVSWLNQFWSSMAGGRNHQKLWQVRQGVEGDEGDWRKQLVLWSAFKRLVFKRPGIWILRKLSLLVTDITCFTWNSIHFKLYRASSESSDLSSGSASPERATSPSSSLPRDPDNALERGGGEVKVTNLAFFSYLIFMGR